MRIFNETDVDEGQLFREQFLNPEGDVLSNNVTVSGLFKEYQKSTNYLLSSDAIHLYDDHMYPLLRVQTTQEYQSFYYVRENGLFGLRSGLEYYAKETQVETKDQYDHNTWNSNTLLIVALVIIIIFTIVMVIIIMILQNYSNDLFALYRKQLQGTLFSARKNMPESDKSLQDAKSQISQFDAGNESQIIKQGELNNSVIQNDQLNSSQVVFKNDKQLIQQKESNFKSNEIKYANFQMKICLYIVLFLVSVLFLLCKIAQFKHQTRFIYWLNLFLFSGYFGLDFYFSTQYLQSIGLILNHQLLVSGRNTPLQYSSLLMIEDIVSGKPAIEYQADFPLRILMTQRLADGLKIQLVNKDLPPIFSDYMDVAYKVLVEDEICDSDVQKTQARSIQCKQLFKELSLEKNDLPSVLTMSQEIIEIFQKLQLTDGTFYTQLPILNGKQVKRIFQLQDYIIAGSNYIENLFVQTIENIRDKENLVDGVRYFVFLTLLILNFVSLYLLIKHLSGKLSLLRGLKKSFTQEFKNDNPRVEELINQIE